MPADDPPAAARPRSLDLRERAMRDFDRATAKSAFGGLGPVVGTGQRAAMEYFLASSGAHIGDATDSVTNTRLSEADPRRPWTVYEHLNAAGTELKDLAERTYQADNEALAAAAAIN